MSYGIIHPMVKQPGYLYDRKLGRYRFVSLLTEDGGEVTIES